MYSVGIIGFGRFGRLLGRILAGDFHVVAYDRSPQDGETGVELTHLDTVLGQQTIFIAIPIREFKSVILDIAPRLRNDVTVLDVCSVKVYPVTVMVEGLPGHVGIIATHPLFGPDSISRSDSLRMMMSATRDVHGKYSFWKAYFESKSISVVQMTPEEHDQLAARTQGVTHFVGRVLKEGGIAPTTIDTLGFRDLLAVVDQTCHDSWELFVDLQNYNPYTPVMIEDLEASIRSIRGKIFGRT